MFVSHCPRHLAVSSQDLPHPHYFCTSTRIPVRFLLKILNIHMYKNHTTWSYLPIPRPSPYFFDPYRLGFLPHLGQVRLVSGFFAPENSRPPIFIDGGMGGQPSGGFFLCFCIYFGVFSPIPITFILNKSYL